MNGYEEAYAESSISANGILIHYYHSKAPVKKTIMGRPRATLPVIMLHGVTDNGLCWLRVANALNKDYDLYMPDARGHGLSDAPEMGYGVEDRAADVAGLIRELGVNRPVPLGHSMGAETAIGVAALFPELVRGVILEDPPWPGRFYGSTPEERNERAARWREDILRDKEKSRDELLAQARAEHPNWTEEELGPWADSKQQVSEYVGNLVLAPRRRWSDYVRQAQCPILLLTADVERGAIVNPQTAQEAALFWKTGRTINIPNAGHNIRREQFEPYMQAVREFLARQS